MKKSKQSGIRACCCASRGGIVYTKNMRRVTSPLIYYRATQFRNVPREYHHLDYRSLKFPSSSPLFRCPGFESPERTTTRDSSAMRCHCRPCYLPLLQWQEFHCYQMFGDGRFGCGLFVFCGDDRCCFAKQRDPWLE